MIKEKGGNKGEMEKKVEEEKREGKIDDKGEGKIVKNGG